MTKKIIGNVRNQIRGSDLDDAIYQSLLINGDILPTSEDEVRFVESYGNLTDVELPKSSLSSSDVIKTARDRRERGEKLAPRALLYTETEMQNVARAARRGTVIDSETEVLMKEAREKYELNSKEQ